MCTAVLLRRPGHLWPLIFAGNRDEMKDRAWRPPARHWPDRPDLVAGRDEAAGGSWLGLNDHGVFAAVLNRTGSLGPQAGKRSRGELVLEALDHADAAEAARALAQLAVDSYRSFNLVVADNRDAYWLRHAGEAGLGRIEVIELPPGLSFMTAHERNDSHASARARAFLPRFQAAPAPDPDNGDWGAWQDLLASRLFDTGAGPESAMTVVTDFGFETTSSSLIALPAPVADLVVEARKPIWRFAQGRPDLVPFKPIGL